MVPSICSILLTVILIGKAKTQNYYVAVPKALRLNSDEIIGVSIDGNAGGPVDIYVQDHPGKAKTITRTIVELVPGKPQLFKIRLDTENFPSGFLSAPGIPKYVSLSARFQSYHKELLVPINYNYGHMFVQTDKPIYKPKDKVLFRIIPLNEDSMPSYETFQLQIRNPNNTIVEQHLFEGKGKDQLEKAFVSHVYKFPTYPVLGEWSAIVQYGYNLDQNSTVRFQLQEYVLPMFKVELETPDVILPTDDVINIKVYAKYVYGKKLQGEVSFRLGIKKPTDSKTTFFEVISSNKFTDGYFNLELNTNNLMRNKKVGFFPEIRNSHLVVEATVQDTATGNKEEVVNSKCLFTDIPLSISFKRCLEDFRPGHTTIIEADISYANGEPASEILTNIEAKADNGEPIQIKQNSTRSDKEGKVSFAVRPQLDNNAIFITLTAVDKGFLAEANFVQRAFQSTTRSYIALDRMSQTLKPNDIFKRIIHYEPIGLSDIYYLVMNKGKIVMMNKLTDGKYGDQHVTFKVTHEMVPSFRILIFAHHEQQLLVDSLKIDVENECNPKAQVSIHPEYSVQEPGTKGEIIIRGSSEGSQGTFVGLLGVDEAVYALSKKDVLTKAKIFKKLGSHDLGCGAGGGLTVSDVLGKAGVILGTNVYSPLYSYSCAERRRKRRAASIRWDMVERYNGLEKECCRLGLEHNDLYRSCYKNAAIVEKYLKDVHANCSKVFLDCCRNRYIFDESPDGADYFLLVRPEKFDDDIGIIDTDPELENDMERESTVRTYFPETWIFEDVTIGPDNQERVRADLPHSITTWILQAVSVSPTHGICITEPTKIVSFQKVFLHLNLPYSVVRHEQVEIQATIFNYDKRPIRAAVYMYGAEGLCSSTNPGEKSEKQYVTVEGQSAASATFPVLPLKAGVIPIKVVALSALGSDVIERELNVVPEGITKVVTIPIILDPTNLQRRDRRLVENVPYLSDYIDSTQNTQATTVKLDLCLPDDFVPGTESCSISAIGDVFGPALQFAINDPESLLIEPTGCGEQNMMKLAPTLYAMRYLKLTGKLTPEIEEKGYRYMQQGYANQLYYRKGDGSYAAFKDRPSNTWLTAFVLKVFCQASQLIYIHESVLCSGITWLIDNQQSDGSFVENYPLYESKLMGGINGRVPFTAFVLIALEECKCHHEGRLTIAKSRALSYLEDHLGSVNLPLSTAIVAYALNLSGSDLASAANENLLSLAKYDDGTNRMYWSTEDSAHDIQTAGYALLTQMLFNDMQKGTSIVNWLNTKQLKSGAYESTQDTMIALQAMSEYAIKAQVSPINLVTTISSSNDRFSEKTLAFNDQNAQVLQDIKIDKVGGALLINTKGEGISSLSVSLRYNVIVPPEDCKFDIRVNVTDTRHEELMNNLRCELKSGRDGPFYEFVVDNHKLKYRISICVRYLGDNDTDMSIVYVGMFSGFQPLEEDLLKIEQDAYQLIEKTEISERGVIFYLSKIPFTYEYCFNFRVVRQYIVGNAQMSYIKVYDYYNPETTCTKSYKPISTSSEIRAICEGGICQCAEGGCPPRTPFNDIQNLEISERRSLLKDKFCNNFDYVWKGKLHYIRKEGGFINISFTVHEVIKAGIESLELIEGETRTLLSRDNCLTADLQYDATYLILGKDGEGYMKEYGHIWYRYFLDQTSIIQLWLPRLKDIKDEKSRQLQRDLKYVTDKLKKEGCDL